MKLFTKIIVFKKSIEEERGNNPSLLSASYTPETSSETTHVHPLVEKLANAKDNASIYSVLMEYSSNPQHVKDIPDFKNQCLTKLRSLHSSSAASSSAASSSAPSPRVTPSSAPSPRVTPPNAASPRVTPPSGPPSRVTQLAASYAPENETPNQSRTLDGPASLVTRDDYITEDPNHFYAPNGNIQEQRERKLQEELLTTIIQSGWLDRRPTSDIEKLVKHHHSMNDDINEFLSNFTYDQQKLTRKNIFKWVETLKDSTNIKTHPELLSLLANYTDYYAKLNSVIGRSPELSQTIRSLVKPSRDDLKKLGDVPRQEDITDEERSLFDPMNNPMIARFMQHERENKEFYPIDDIDISSQPPEPDYDYDYGYTYNDDDAPPPKDEGLNDEDYYPY